MFDNGIINTRHIRMITYYTGFLGNGFLGIGLVSGVYLYPFRILVIILALFSSWNIMQFKFKGCKKGILLFFLFWLVYAGIALFWAFSKTDALKNFIFLSFNIMFLISFIASDDDKELIKKMNSAWQIMLIISISVGFWNIATGQYLIQSKVQNNAFFLNIGIPKSFYYNQNDYAAYLSFAYPFVLVPLAYERGRLKKLFFMIMAISCVFQVILTFSRLCYMSITVETLIFIHNLHFKRKIVILSVISIIFYLVFAFTPLGGLIFSEIASLAQAGNSSGDIIRINLFKNLIQLFLGSAGLGVGGGNIEVLMARGNLLYTDGVYNPHNWWMELLVSYGSFVALGYLLFFFFLLIGLINVLKKAKCILAFKWMEQYSLQGILVIAGFVFSSFSSSSMLNSIPHWLFYVFCIGIITAGERIQ